MKGVIFKSWKIEAMATKPDKIWQTRRAIGEVNGEPDAWSFVKAVRVIPPVKKDGYICQHNDGHCITVTPRYHVGEVVYIKEAFWYPPFGHNQNQSMVAYRLVVSLNCGEEAAAKCRWKNPRTMPAWAARHFIKILDVQACRTKDISFEDCLAEGVVDSPFWQTLDYKAPAPLHPDNHSNAEADKETDRGWIEYARQAYFALYDSINGTGAHERNWDFRYFFVKLDKRTP